jgi:hypothetical protein
MGHIRLGEIPKTHKWDAVVAQMAGESGVALPTGAAADVAKIAAQTLDAAQAGLNKALDDPGLRYAFYLLTQIVLAARESNWQERLTNAGVRLEQDSSVFDLAAELQASIDDRLSRYRGPTDVSEMAQQAAGEAIVALVGPRAATLFGAGQKELLGALRELSTKKGFAELGQRFFGRFMARFLNFYLSRISAAQVGGRAFQQVGDVSGFNELLRAHCEQSARIVRDFCGEWYSKTEFQEGISLDNTSRFLAVALKKLQAELERQKTER